MKNYTIISTYPAMGSKNIGDGLITLSCKQAIIDLKGEDTNVEVIWRADSWENVKERILNSDAVIFSNFCIRTNMYNQDQKSVYPYLDELLDSGIPLAALSASTQLKLNDEDRIFSNFPKETLTKVKIINDRALFFTTRGYLSQSFCEFHKYNKVEFTGDIAFYDKRYTNRIFETNFEIKKIAISDPHYSGAYMLSLKELIAELKRTFTKAEIIVIIHGENKKVEKFCQSNGVKFINIYLDLEKGLDVYDEFDLHIGYRVHGHVSALKRRIPSYLLVQDGRGFDYQLSFNINVSIQHFFTEKIKWTPKNLIKKILNKKLYPDKTVANLLPVKLIMVMVLKDSRDGFKKFEGFEKQIKHFNDLCIKALEKLP